MEHLDEKKIRLLVIQTLRQMGLMPAAANHQPNSQATRPRALIVFNGGLRLTDEALEQVQRIKKLCSKTAFLTVPAARGVLCKDDIKGRVGGRCILDTVSRDGVEKVLSVSDVLVLPTFCFNVAVRVANLFVEDFEAQLVFTALMQGKKVMATRDSFSFLELVKNEKIQNEIDLVLKKLEGMGVRLCETRDLENAFLDLFGPEEKSQNTGSPKQQVGARLITGRLISEAFEKGIKTIKLATGGKVTPLARDLAKEYSIEIVSESETK